MVTILPQLFFLLQYVVCVHWNEGLVHSKRVDTRARPQAIRKYYRSRLHSTEKRVAPAISSTHYL
jgi:hypothetical protein